MPPTLATERLLLRPLRPDDADALFAIYSDPEVMRYWSSAPWESIENAQTFLQTDAERHAAGPYLTVGMQTAADEQLIGVCTLFAFNRQCRRAELGYSMARRCWGRGYMHEALTALLDYAFAVLDLHRLEADIDPRNLASARTLERLGFVKEGHLRERWIVNDEISDTGLYGLLRREWEQRRTMR